MHSRFSTLALLFTLTVATLTATAQPRPEPPAKLPFTVGESLSYEGKISKVIQGLSVVELTLTVKDKTADGDLLINAEARSKGTLVKLFGFSFLQVLDSTMRSTDLSSLKTVKQDMQKKRVRNSEAMFDYEENRVIYSETDPNEPMRPPRLIASDITGRTHDLVSGIYHIRTLPLAVGKTFELTVSDSGLIYKVPVRVTGRERLNTDIGRVWCFKVEPEVFGEGRMIEREGSMVIWITEDDRRIPVRSQVKASFGKLEIKIQGLSNNGKMASK